jgi:hypothetical protein
MKSAEDFGGERLVEGDRNPGVGHGSFKISADERD